MTFSDEKVRFVGKYTPFVRCIFLRRQRREGGREGGRGGREGERERERERVEWKTSKFHKPLVEFTVRTLAVLYVLLKNIDGRASDRIHLVNKFMSYIRITLTLE